LLSAPDTGFPAHKSHRNTRPAQYWRDKAAVALSSGNSPSPLLLSVVVRRRPALLRNMVAVLWSTQRRKQLDAFEKHQLITANSVVTCGQILSVLASVIM